ncbi:hypothetical protein SO802_031734 [Lithocarpus litseifolius]|uniref:Uncharacterized protein n=1 Tax=Lithocarpus litseifolius TaxID=425828 RepID=A0AAW2BMD4_9ROSI
MFRCSSHGKEQVIDLTSSPVLKKTRHSSGDFDNERFKTFLDSQSFSNNFKSAPIMVERVVRFDTLGSTFIPKIFVDKDWVSLFGNFEETIDELVKEFYLNTWFTRDELKLAPMIEILDILRANHEVSSTGTSIGTTIFGLEMKILTLIMFFNLYTLSNTGFINLRRAQFLCDLIKGAQIDICAYTFQTMGKIAGRSAAQMCLPFYSLAMKIMILKGVRPLKEGTILSRQRPISLISLQMSKSDSSAEKAKKSPFKTPKSESF